MLSSSGLGMAGEGARHVVLQRRPCPSFSTTGWRVPRWHDSQRSTSPASGLLICRIYNARKASSIFVIPQIFILGVFLYC